VPWPPPDEAVQLDSLRQRGGPVIVLADTELRLGLAMHSPGMGDIAVYVFQTLPTASAPVSREALQVVVLNVQNDGCPVHAS